MKKLLAILFFGLFTWALQFPLASVFSFHSHYDVVVVFFVIQNIILLRIEQAANPEFKVQVRMVNIGVRLVTALAFILVMYVVLKVQDNSFYLQFILLYLAFMTFEIIMALANLRRN